MKFWNTQDYNVVKIILLRETLQCVIQTDLELSPFRNTAGSQDC
jgi:hypothetical protein